MKLILSLLTFSNLLTTVMATNYMWGELNFGDDNIDVNDYCSSTDLGKLNDAVTYAVEDCVSTMTAKNFVLDAPPEDGRRLISCGLTCSSQCLSCIMFCRGWRCTARRLGSPEPSFMEEERQLSCSVDMNWEEDRAVQTFVGTCYNDAVNKAYLSHSCRNFLFSNTEINFFAEINE